MFFLFADDDVKTDDLELYFCKVLRCKCFCKKLYFGYCNLFTRKDLLERCLLERIKSLVGHLQFMVEQKHNLFGHLILPRVFLVGQNVRCVFRLVGHCPISDRCFTACYFNIYIYIYMYVCMYVYISYICMYIYHIYVCIYIYIIFIYLYIYIYVYISVYKINIFKCIFVFADAVLSFGQFCVSITFSKCLTGIWIRLW